MAVQSALAARSLRAWADAQRATLDRLDRALAIVGRGSATGARTSEDLLHGLLLSVLRRHDEGVDAAMRSFDDALVRLVDDIDDIRSLEALRGTDGPGRDRALRQADLRTVVDTLDRLESAENQLRRLLDEGDPDLHRLARELVEGLPPASPPAAASSSAATGTPGTVTTPRRGGPPRPPRPLEDSLREARSLLAEADLIEADLARGTVAGRRGPLRLSWPEHPRALEAVQNLRDARVRLRQRLERAGTRAGGPRPGAVDDAVRQFQREVARTSETLRSLAEGFVTTRERDRLVPLRPSRDVPAPGDAVAAARARASADALAVAGRVRALDAGRSGPVPAATLLDALEFDTPRTGATGTLGEPLARTLPGGTTEIALLTPSDIRALPTDPPWLAADLAAVVDGYQRAHLVGPGFGPELVEGLSLAPEGVNQIAQNRGIEDLLRRAADVGIEVTPTVTVDARRLAIPLADGTFESVDVMTAVRYEIPTTDGRTLRFTVDVDADGAWRVTHDLPAGALPADLPLSGTR